MNKIVLIKQMVNNLCQFPNFIHQESGDSSRERDYIQRWPFRVSGKIPELWEPLTGKMYQVQFTQQVLGLTTIDLQFEPSQSWFAVFRDKPSANLLAKNPFSTCEDVQKITAQWKVSFEPQWGSDGTITLEQFRSWSEQSYPRVKYYSGTATYKTTFDLKESSLKSNYKRNIGE